MYPVLMLVAQSVMLDCGWFGNPFHAQGERILFFGVVSGIGTLKKKKKKEKTEGKKKRKQVTKSVSKEREREKRNSE